MIRNYKQEFYTKIYAETIYKIIQDLVPSKHIC